MPGCWLANNTGEQVEGSARARGLVGWALGPFLPKVPWSKAPRSKVHQGFCPMLIFAFWVRVKSKFQESGRGSFFVASPLPSNLRQLQVHTSLLAPLRPVTSTLVPRNLYDGHDDFLALLPCPPRSLLTLDLPPLTAAAPPPSRPSHLPGVSHRHCHDFNLPLRTGAPRPVSQLDPHQLYK